MVLFAYSCKPLPSLYLSKSHLKALSVKAFAFYS